MNTNYDNEATQYQNSDNEATQYQNADNEATQLEETAVNEETTQEETAQEETVQEETSNDEAEVKGSKKEAWKHAAVGAASGLLIGSVATVLMGMKSPDAESTEEKQESNNNKEELSHPEWVDDQIQVATTVNDDMSFGEAFAAARTEVGPGGCFEWHGNVYSTYLAEEWSSMTADQRAEYGSHFSWNHIDHSQSNVAQHTNTADSHHTAQAETPAAGDDIEIVSVNHDHNSNDVAQHTEQPSSQAQAVEVTQVENPVEDTDIEILGVVHDDATGANIGGILVDNQEVVLIDVDGNLTFDYMASDVNQNGVYDQNELIDIQDQNLTVNDLGGFSNPAGDMMTSNDTTDYSSDVYEG